MENEQQEVLKGDFFNIYEKYYPEFFDEKNYSCFLDLCLASGSCSEPTDPVSAAASGTLPQPQLLLHDHKNNPCWNLREVNDNNNNNNNSSSSCSSHLRANGNGNIININSNFLKNQFPQFPQQPGAPGVSGGASVPPPIPATGAPPPPPFSSCFPNHHAAGTAGTAFNLSFYIIFIFQSSLM